MTSRAAPLLALLAVSACDVHSTVGYIDGALVGGLSCSPAELASCDAGGCSVSQVFSPREGAITLAADESDLFYLTGPQSFARRPIGGGPSVDLAVADSTLMHLASDATHVYWTELDGNVRGVPKLGGARFDAGYVFGNPSDIAVDSSHLYWVFPEFGQVAMAQKPSGAATHISDQASPRAITADGTHVYWVNAGSAAGTGELVRAQRGDLGTAEILLSGLDAPVAVSAGGGAVYFASKTGLFRLVDGEASAQTVATGFTEVKDIAVYGESVYGVGIDGLWKAPASGGDWQPLERRGMSGMAVTCSAVYATGWFESALVRYGP